MDGAQTWDDVNQGLTDLYILSIAVDPTDPKHVLVGTLTSGVFVSRDAGSSWIRATGFNLITQVNALVFDARNPTVAYCGTGTTGYNDSPPGLWATGDGGGTWSTRPAVLAGAPVTALAIDPENSATIFGAARLGGGDFVFKSVDTGHTAAPVFEPFQPGTNLPPYVTDVSVGSIAIDPTDSNTLYIATSSLNFGAVFKSTDGGLSWFPMNTGMGIQSVRSVAIDPIHPTTLYAGVGGGNQERLSMSSPGTWNGAIFRSDDSGLTWSAVGGDFSDRSIETVVVSASTPGTIFAATDFCGVLRSKDAAKSWSLANNGLQAIAVSDIAFDPKTAHTLYISTRGLGLFKTQDSGLSWHPAGVGVQPEETSVVTISPQDSSTLFSASSYGFYGSPFGYGFGDSFAGVGLIAVIYRSVDGGISWRPTGMMRRIDDPLLAHEVWNIGVSSSNDKIVYAAQGQSIFRSSNGGAQWDDVGSSFPEEGFGGLAVSPADPDIVMVGGGVVGLQRSMDGGNSWTQVLPVGALDLRTDGHAAIAGTDGGLYTSLDNGGSWLKSAFPGGFVGAADMDPGDSSAIYGVPYGESAPFASGVLLRSTDFGNTWTRISDGFPLGSARAYPFDDRVAVSSAGTVALAPKGGGVYLLDDPVRDAIDLSISSVRLRRGRSQSMTVTLIAPHHSTKPTFTVSGQPQSVSASFSPPEAVSQGFASTLTLSASKVAPLRQAMLTVGAAFDAKFLQASASLRVIDSPTAAIREFTLPADNSPYSICSSADGSVWYTDPLNNRIVRRSSGGQVTEFTVPTPRSGLWAIAAGSGAEIWFTELLAGKIGRLDPSGHFVEFSMSDLIARPTAIIAGPDGAMWFTDATPSQNLKNRIGRITRGGQIREFDIPTPICQPYGIATGSDGALWFTEYTGNNIGRIDLEGNIREFPLPVSGSFPRGVAAGADGAMWFIEERGMIGRIDDQGRISEFPIPSKKSAPNSLALGPDGNLWFAEENSDSLGRITSAGTVTEFAVPTDGSAPYDLTWGADGSIWFTEATGNRLGRFELNGLPPVYPGQGQRLRIKPITVPPPQPLIRRN